MNNNKFKYIAIIVVVFFVVIPLLMLMILFFEPGQVSPRLLEFRQSNIEGKITGFYVDRGATVLTINNIPDKEFSVNPITQNGRLFSSIVQIGDSLIKIDTEDSFLLKKQNGNVYGFKLGSYKKD